MAVTQHELEQLYLAYFGRPPDFDGLSYYLNSPDVKNATIWDIAVGFSNSQESKDLYGPTFNASMIDAIYMNLFNRHAEPDGVKYWSGEVTSGRLSAAGAAMAILLGAQGTDKTAVENKLAVSHEWVVHLDTTEELKGYSGNDAMEVARDFLATVDHTTASVTAAMAGLDTAIAESIETAPATPTFTLSMDAPTLVEGNAGTKVMTFTLTLDRAPESALTLNYQTLTDGSGVGHATKDEDFQGAAGTVTFAAGQKVATVSITVLGDTTFEGNETFKLQVSGSSLANTVEATGTIVEDDVEKYTATVSASDVLEGNAGTKVLKFVVTLSSPAAGPVTLTYKTLLTGTATSGDDFDAAAGSITFAAGETTKEVTVTINSDVTVEDNETVVLEVSGSKLESTVTGTGTILNDDVTPMLTTGIDTINVTGTGANTIKGIVDGTTPSNSTFSVGDTITGNGQTTLQLAVAVGGTAALAYVDNVAKVDVIAGVGSAIDFNAGLWNNVGAVNLAAGVNGLTVHIDSLQEGVDLSIGAGVGGEISATYQAGLFADIWNSGKGGASFVDGAVNINVADSATAGAFFSNDHDLTLGNITVAGGADNALVSVTAMVDDAADLTVGNINIEVGDSAIAGVVLTADSGDISAGGVAIAAGDSASALFTASGSGDITIASIGEHVGDSGFASVSVSSQGGGDITVGGVAQEGGDSATLDVWVWGDGSINIGSISQSVGSGTAASDYVYISNTGSGDITIGGITQQGATSAEAGAWIYQRGDGDVSVGDVVQSVGNSASLSVSTTGSGDITIGDVTQTASTSDAYVWVYADEGNVTVGNISQTFGDTATVSITSTASGDITVGDVTQVGGTAASANFFVYGSSTSGTGGDISVGDVSQVVGSSGYASVSISADGDGTITVGNIDQSVGNAGTGAEVHVYGNSDVTVGDVTIGLGDATISNTSNQWASLSINAAGELTVGDITVVAGANQNAYAYVSNNYGGDVTIGDVFVGNGGNTATSFTNYRNAEFFAYNFNTSGDLTVGNVEMVVGQTNTGTLSVSLDGTFNESLGDLTIGNIDVTLADKANIYVDIEATHTASTSVSATNVVNAGDLTVGDINVAMGTNASFSLSLDHALWQSGSSVGGDLGDTTVGLVTVNGGVGAQVVLDYEISNSVSYTTSGTAALVVQGAIGDVSLGGFDLNVDDGGHIAVEVDIIADGAIGDVELGDLKAAVGVSGSVTDFSVTVSGASVGDVTIGDVSLQIGEQGNATTGINVHVTAFSGSIGDITIGDITSAVGKSGDIQTIDMSFTATGDIGAISIGDVSWFVGYNASLDGLDFDAIASGDIESFSMGDFNATVATSASVSTMLEIHLAAANIGDVTFGNEVVTVGANAGSVSGDSVSITATGDIGNVTFGNIAYHVTGASGSADGVIRTINAGGTLGDVTFGDVTMDVKTSASITSGFYFHLTGAEGVGDVTFGDINLSATSASGSQYMSIDVNATSGDIASFSLGDVNVSSVNPTATSDYGQLYVTASASGEIGDIKIGNVSLNAENGNAWATLNFVAADYVGDVTIGNVDLVADSGQAYFSLDLSGAGLFDNDLSVGTITFDGTGTTVSVTANIFADSGDVSIAGITVHGTGAQQFGTAYNLSVTGNNIEIGTIAIDVTAATGAYNITNVLSAVTAGGSLTLGTVDYSGYKEAGAGQAGETIDVSTFNGTITVIGTARGDTIIGNDEANTFTGGAGDDTFDFTGVAAQDIDAVLDARVIDTITDFKAGPTAGEKIVIDAANTGVAFYAEKTATSLDNAITVALQTMADPVHEADIVAVKVGGDTYVMVDMAGNDHIDTIIKLVGVDTAKLDFGDFTVI